jgi:hypothetical protein
MGLFDVPGPTLLTPAQIQGIPLAQPAPMPFARQPSILDRLSARLFPMGAYTGLLDPQAQQGLQHQSLLGLGTSLLQQSGPSPYRIPFGAAIGNALQQSQVNFPQMAQQALQIQAYKSQQAEQQAVAQVAAKHPAIAGETPQQRYDRQLAMVTDLMTIPGGAAIAEKYAPVLAATKPDKATAGREPMRIPDTRDNVIGSPTHGLVGTTLLDPDTHQRVGFIPQEQKDPTAIKPTNDNLQKAEFGAAALAAWQPLEKLRTQNPGVEAEVGKIMAAPAFVTAIPGFRSAGDAVAALQKAGASTAAQNYMRAKWAFLDNVVRTRFAGARLSGAVLAQMGQEFMPSLDPGANEQVRNNELQAMLTAQGQSGFDANPQLWRNAVKRHGVSGVDLQALLAGGSGDTQLNAIRDRYR